MIDIVTHRIIDMIPSRDYNEVKNWLKSFPNLRVISRDGSITYNNAITDAHPNAIQVSDRFHLLKNLTSYCKDYLVKFLKVNVKITSTSYVKHEESEIKSKSVENKKLTLKEKCEKIEALLLEGNSKTRVCKLLNMDIRTFEKLYAMTDGERESKFENKVMLKHEEKVAQKQEKINQVREMFNHRFSIREISKEMKLSRKTVKAYLDPNFSPIHASYGQKKDGILSPYIKEIDVYVKDGYTATEIYKILEAKGYKGSKSTISHYISNWKLRYKKNYFEDKKVENSEFVDRKKLLKLLYIPHEKVKDLSNEQLSQVYIEYPIFFKIITIVNSFRKLISNKNSAKLENWINEVKKLEIKEINSFIVGVLKDIEAVKNAIAYDYNNGLAEGSVNKLKVIKRIMYGRCDFETLRKKVLKLEFLRKIN